MSIKVNEELCIGCGTCEALCPAVFRINDAAKAEVVSQTDAECAKNAAETCPTQAIEVK